MDHPTKKARRGERFYCPRCAMADIPARQTCFVRSRETGACDDRRHIACGGRVQSMDDITVRVS